MGRTAARLGHEWAVLTDHSPRLTVARGLSAERLREQLETVAALNTRWAPFRLLTGIECDILDDGSLDQEPALLERLDVVVVSVHSKLRMDARSMTRRMIAAVRNPHADVLGHCTGRLVTGRGRPESEFDAEAVFAACAESGTAVEINSRPERLDPPRRLLRQAVEAGTLFSIDTDAHAPGQLDWQIHGSPGPRSAGAPRACDHDLDGRGVAGLDARADGAHTCGGALTWYPTPTRGRTGHGTGGRVRRRRHPRRHQSSARHDVVGGVPSGRSPGVDARHPPVGGPRLGGSDRTPAGPPEPRRGRPAARSAHTALYGTFFDRLPPLKDAGRLLRRLDQDGWNVVLATSAGGRELSALRQAIAADDAIAATASADDVEAGKPSPEPVEHALELAGVPPEAAVFVGDTVWDMQAGTRAGVTCIGLLSGGIPKADLREAGARAIYRDPSHLLAMLADSPLAPDT